MDRNIFGLGLLFVALLGIALMVRKDGFNITTDPLRARYDYDTLSCGKYPNAHRNGLNLENDNNISICSFNNQFNNDTVFLENVNMDPCALTARQYCSVLYSGHEEYFMNKYSGLGECEKAETERCRSCGDLKVNKQQDVYYTQINRGV